MLNPAWLWPGLLANPLGPMHVYLRKGGRKSPALDGENFAKQRVGRNSRALAPSVSERYIANL